MNIKNNSVSNGFTIVELLITLLVATTFVLAFTQLYLLIETEGSIAEHRAKASSLAYFNLRMYTEDERPSWFVCNAATDLSANANAPGQVLVNSPISDPSALPRPATQKVVAYAPFGCNTNMPIKLLSTIEYGQNPVRKVVHGTYAGN